MIKNIQKNFLFVFLLLIALSPSVVSTPFKNVYAYFLMMLIVVAFICERAKINRVVFFYGLSFILIPVPAIFNSIIHQELNIASVLFTSFRFMLLGVLVWTLYKYSSLINRESDFMLLKLFLILNVVVVLLGYAIPSFNNLIFFLYYNQESYDEFYAYMLGRPGGLLGNPNTLAMTMVFVLFFFLPRNLNIKFKGVYISVIIFIILITKSRTGLFGLGLGLSLYFVLMRRLNVLLYFLFLTCLVMTFGIMSGYLDLTELSERYISGINLSGRDLLWIDILNDPFYSENYILGTLSIPDDFKAVDNEYLNILVRYGVFGLFMFSLVNIFIIAYFVLLFFKNKNNEMAALTTTCVFVFLIFCLAGSPLTSLKLCFVYLTVLSFFINKSLEFYNESISYGTRPA